MLLLSYLELSSFQMRKSKHRNAYVFSFLYMGYKENPPTTASTKT